MNLYMIPLHIMLTHINIINKFIIHVEILCPLYSKLYVAICIIINTLIQNKYKAALMNRKPSDPNSQSWKTYICVYTYVMPPNVDLYTMPPNVSIYNAPSYNAYSYKYNK